MAALLALTAREGTVVSAVVVERDQSALAVTADMAAGAGADRLAAVCQPGT